MKHELGHEYLSSLSFQSSPSSLFSRFVFRIWRYERELESGLMRGTEERGWGTREEKRKGEMISEKWEKTCERTKGKEEGCYSPRMPSWLLLFLDLRTDALWISWGPLLYDGPALAPLQSTHHLWDATELLQISPSYDISTQICTYTLTFTARTFRRFLIFTLELICTLCSFIIIFRFRSVVHSAGSRCVFEIVIVDSTGKIVEINTRVLE